MNDKELLARGAEVVGGDMFLKRVKMGSYRNGQFIITPEGQAELKAPAPDKPTVRGLVQPKPAEKPKTRSAKVETPPASLDLDALDNL